MNKFALILSVMAALLLAGCTSSANGLITPETVQSDTEARTTAEASVPFTSDAVRNTEAAAGSRFYSTEDIKIEDMDFGGIRFGDTKQEVVRVLGEPEGIEELHGAYCYKDFTLNFTDEDKVCDITIANQTFSCYRDIRIGDDILPALKKLPIPTAPSGLESVYTDFSGEFAHDSKLLDNYFIEHTKDPQMPDEPNYRRRSLEFSFDNYVLSIWFESQYLADHSDGKYRAGEIGGIQVRTADAPAFDD